MKVLITGGTGFIGRHLVKHFQDQQAEVWVISRRSAMRVKQLLPGAHPVKWCSQLPRDCCFDLVINLAGASLFTRPWTNSYRKLIHRSRIQTTERLVEWIRQADVKPKMLISGSAVGYYGDRGDQYITEQSDVGDDFPARLCQDWEQAALRAEPDTRVVLMRTGIVLGDGGALKSLMLPFKMGLGTVIGHGQQYWPWIHIHDLVQAVDFLAHHPVLTGPVNLSAPHPVRVEEFCHTLANKLNRKIRLPAIPDGLLDLVTFGGSAALMQSARMVPEQLEAAGFQFQYSHLEKALADLVSSQ